MRYWTSRGALALSFCLISITLYLTLNLASDPLGGGMSVLKQDGVWRSRGYGWVLSIKNDRMTVYHASKKYCIKDKNPEFGRSDIKAKVVDGSNGRVLRITIDDPSYFYTFDRIEQLPEACRDNPGKGADAIFDAVVDIFSTHYPFFEERRVNWPRLSARYKREIKPDTSEKQLFKIISRMLSEIRDGHVSLKAKAIGRKFASNSKKSHPTDIASLLSRFTRFAFGNQFDSTEVNGYWTSGIGAELVGGTKNVTANGKIRFGIIDGDIGYLEIKEMEGMSRKDVETSMGEVLTEFANVSAVIVDVSRNPGGLDTIGTQLAGRFAEKETLAYYKFAGDGDTSQKQPMYVRPSGPSFDTGTPVYVITSHLTASAAEIFVISMRALPNVTHVGQATEGILSDELLKPLPNGWRLGLSNEVYLDSKMKNWEAVGIAPEIKFEVRAKKTDANKDVAAARDIVEFMRTHAKSNR